MKKIILYLLYITVMLLFVYYGGIIGSYLKVEMGQTFEPYKMMLFSAVYPILAGKILALPGFISTFNKPGTWTFNTSKFLIVGIPALIGALGLVIFHLNPGGMAAKFFFWANIWGVQGTTVCGVLFGYTLLSVMEKTEDKNIFISNKTSFFR